MINCGSQQKPSCVYKYKWHHVAIMINMLNRNIQPIASEQELLLPSYL